MDQKQEKILLVSFFWPFHSVWLVIPYMAENVIDISWEMFLPSFKSFFGLLRKWCFWTFTRYEKVSENKVNRNALWHQQSKLVNISLLFYTHKCLHLYSIRGWQNSVKFSYYSTLVDHKLLNFVILALERGKWMWLCSDKLDINKHEAGFDILDVDCELLY